MIRTYDYHSAAVGHKDFDLHPCFESIAYSGVGFGLIVTYEHSEQNGRCIKCGEDLHAGRTD